MDGNAFSYFLESHLGNIPEKFELHWPMGLGGDSILSKFYTFFSIFSSGGQFVHQSGTVLDILVEGHLSNISMKFELNQPRGIENVGI